MPKSQNVAVSILLYMTICISGLAADATTTPGYCRVCYHCQCEPHTGEILCTLNDLDHSAHCKSYCGRYHCPKTTTKQTTTATTTPPRTTQPHTTSVHLEHLTTQQCDKINVIDAYARNLHYSDNRATRCPSGSHQSADAFILKMCHSRRISHWRQGVKIMDLCASNKEKMYYPVGTFKKGVTNTYGVFVGCDPNGFKMVSQTCDNTVSIDTIVPGNSTLNPNDFYMVLWTH